MSYDQRTNTYFSPKKTYEYILCTHLDLNVPRYL